MSEEIPRTRRLSDSDIRKLESFKNQQQRAEQQQQKNTGLQIPQEKIKSKSIQNLQQAKSFDDGVEENYNDNTNNNTRKNTRVTKIAILGDAGVGKSALTVRYITKRFITEYSPTLEATYSYQETIDNQTVIFRIRDTAGQEICREGNMLWADAFICLYSITDENSFDMMKQIVNTITNTRSARCPCIIVGNKTDLSHFRKISRTEGQAFAKSLQFSFREVSVAEDIQEVCEIFKTVQYQVTQSLNARKRGSVSKKIIMSKIFPKRKDNAPRRREMMRTLDSIPQFTFNASALS